MLNKNYRKWDKKQVQYHFTLIKKNPVYVPKQILLSPTC